MNNTCRVCEATTDAFLCKSCLVEVERAIGDMPSLMHEVSVVATGQANVYRANGKPEPSTEVADWDGEQADIPARLRSREGRTTLIATRLPINLPARELLADAWNTLAGWARHLAESRGSELPTADALVGWLLSNVEAIRWDEAAAQCHDELTWLQGHLRRAVDRSPSRVYAGPCHAPLPSGGRCQRPLYGWPGGDEIECDGYRPPSVQPDPYDVGCHAKHSDEDRRAWLLQTIEGSLIGLDEILPALPQLLPGVDYPPRSVVNAWVRQGRLMPVGLTEVGEPSFVGAELLNLVRNYKPHRYAPRQRRTA